MSSKTKGTITIDYTLGTRTTQVVHCTAYSANDNIIDSFDCVCSRTYDTAIVIPATGLHHGPMTTTESAESLIVWRAGMDDGEWARAVATAAVQKYLRYGRAA
jgi:hypothetical protein